MWTVKFLTNRAFWRLDLAIGMSYELESRANCLARLEVLSCSATAGVTLQLPCMLHTCATFGDLPVARSNHEAFLERTLLSFSSHSFTHYPYIILTQIQGLWMLNYKQIWHGIKPTKLLNKFNLTIKKNERVKFDHFVQLINKTKMIHKDGTRIQT